MKDERLIECVVRKHLPCDYDGYAMMGAKEIDEMCIAILAVIRKQVHLVAMVCPKCQGNGKYYQPHGYCRKCADPDLDCDEHTDNELNCPKCKGHGVIERSA